MLDIFCFAVILVIEVIKVDELEEFIFYCSTNLIQEIEALAEQSWTEAYWSTFVGLVYFHLNNFKYLTGWIYRER